MSPVLGTMGVFSFSVNREMLFSVLGYSGFKNRFLLSVVKKKKKNRAGTILNLFTFAESFLRVFFLPNNINVDDKF